MVAPPFTVQDNSFPSRVVPRTSGHQFSHGPVNQTGGVSFIPALGFKQWTVSLATGPNESQEPNRRRKPLLQPVFLPLLFAKGTFTQVSCEKLVFYFPASASFVAEIRHVTYF